MRGRDTTSPTLGALVGLVVVVLVGVLGAPGRAAAHTELESSTPADGATVAAPVDEITLVFTEAVEAVEGGFEVLDPAGLVRAPDAVDSPDGGVTHVLHFTSPLAGGEVGLRWSVVSDDGHVIEGTLSFTVAAPLPTTTTAASSSSTTATAAPTTSAPPPSPTVAPGSAPATSERTSGPATIPETTTATSVAAPSLEDFLGGESAGEVDLRWRRAAQVVSVVAALVAVGLAAFALRFGRRAPAATVGLTPMTAGAGVVLAAGAVLEGAAHAGVVTGRGLGVLGDPADALDALSGSYRLAIALRLLGGLLVAGAVVARARVARGTAGTVATVVAAGAVIASFAFDGHTVSKGDRVVQSLADVVHVAAGSIWLGGVIALTWWAWRRRRAAGAGDADELLATLLRFSGLAAWALLAVAAAGVVMAAGILGSPGELTSTTWGRWLIAKAAAVAVAVAIGAYNRFRLLPALTAAPRSLDVHERVRDALAAEAFLLVVAAVVAGFLVGAQV